MPSNSIDRIQPSTAGPRPQSFAMPGEAKLIDRTSKPSSALSPMVMTTAIHCAEFIGPCSIIDCASLSVMKPPLGRQRRSLVNPREQFDELLCLFLSEPGIEPVFVLADRPLCLPQRRASGLRQVQRQLSPVRF